MAQRIFVCEHCGNTFIRSAWERHKFDPFTKKCYDLDKHLVDEYDIELIPEKKGK